jgi:hypothetical protein
MSNISRRDFFQNVATSAVVAGLLSGGVGELRANPLGLPIGCQTWPVRAMIARDFSGTIKQLAAAGFQRIDWKKIFAAARIGGIKNYFVEMDLDLMKASVPYLRKLQV